jgi:hypothetical protein
MVVVEWLQNTAINMRPKRIGQRDVMAAHLARRYMRSGLLFIVGPADQVIARIDSAADVRPEAGS